MKKRFLAFCIGGLTLLLGLRVLAAGGSSSDPLISLSYLNGTFLTSLQEMFAGWVDEGTAPIYQEATEKLDELGTSWSIREEPEWSYSAHYESLTLKRGDVLTLDSGSGLIWMSGSGTAEGGLVDVSEGAAPETGAPLTVQHRYLNGEESGTSITVLSDAATLLVEGYWSLAQSGEEATWFTDLVKSRDWYYDAVSFAVGEGLFNGVSDTTFGPLISMERSMLAVVLHRLEGEPAVAYSGSFPDIADGQWYTTGVEWAKESGIITGSDNGTFRPFANITRQEIAVMLYRYAGGFLGLDVSRQGDLSGFTDKADVSLWAEEAMSWAVGAGIITGSDLGALNPLNDASRAEVATMLQRLIGWISTAETLQ